MHDGMAVLAKALEVVERERDVGVVDVLRREVDDVVDDLSWPHLANRVAALADSGRDYAEWSVNRRVHVRLAVVNPSG